mgnify:CR=1 FL=1
MCGSKVAAAAAVARYIFTPYIRLNRQRGDEPHEDVEPTADQLGAPEQVLLQEAKSKLAELKRKFDRQGNLSSQRALLRNARHAQEKIVDIASKAISTHTEGVKLSQENLQTDVDAAAQLKEACISVREAVGIAGSAGQVPRVGRRAVAVQRRRVAVDRFHAAWAAVEAHRHLLGAEPVLSAARRRLVPRPR